MADISKVTLLDGNTYNLKDDNARQELLNKQNSLVSGTNIKTINGLSVLGEGNITVSADSSDKVSLTTNESISGKKTFTYGSQTNSAVIIKGSGTKGGSLQVGTPNDTNYSSLAFYRKNSTDNYTNKGLMFVNGDGSLKLCHRRSKSTNVSLSETSNYLLDSALYMSRTRFQYCKSNNLSSLLDTSDGNDILYDGYQTTKLNTDAKDIIGAINELYAAIQSGSGSSAVDGTEVAY